MKTRLILTLMLASFAVSVGAYYELRRSPEPVRFDTALVSRGDLIANVVATGTVQAVTTVEVGTQANGIIKELNADFNSVVHKGEVLARLDPSLFQAEIEQGRAAVEKAKSDVQRLQIALDDANTQLARGRVLLAKQLLDQSDFDTVQVAARLAAADLEAAEAQVAQAQAVVDENRINLDHTIITAPIDGIVIGRNMDVGQTVVSNMAAQTLFEIAEDLSKMQLVATIDESDIGRVHEGDPVRFSVDAYPGHTFTGAVKQVRVNPNIDQNVVTYDTVISVPNPDLKLRPGMTANVSVRVASREDVVRVPANALLFKPNAELFAALHQAVPPPARSEQPSAGGGHRAAGKQNLVWVFRDNQLKPVPVKIGLGDGTNAELVAGGLRPGDAVVLNVRQ
jgi:HlyD family secretion protein